MALGADLCASARGMMMAIGCIQALRCDSNKCPAGIATQDPRLTTGLVTEEKSVRVAKYHQKTIASVAELLGAMGIKHVHEITSDHLFRRCPDGVMRPYSEIYGLTHINRRSNDPFQSSQEEISREKHISDDHKTGHRSLVTAHS